MDYRDANSIERDRSAYYTRVRFSEGRTPASLAIDCRPVDSDKEDRVEVKPGVWVPAQFAKRYA